jgi:hypothetical protein
MWWSVVLSSLCHLLSASLVKICLPTKQLIVLNWSDWVKIWDLSEGSVSLGEAGDLGGLWTKHVHQHWSLCIPSTHGAPSTSLWEPQTHGHQDSAVLGQKGNFPQLKGNVDLQTLSPHKVRGQGDRCTHRCDISTCQKRKQTIQNLPHTQARGRGADPCQEVRINHTIFTDD